MAAAKQCWLFPTIANRAVPGGFRNERSRPGVAGSWLAPVRENVSHGW